MADRDPLLLRRLLELRRVPALAGAELAELAMLAENVVEISHDGGAVVAAPAGPAAIHLILSGRVAAAGVTLGPPRSLGLLEVLARRPLGAPAVALGEARTLRLTAADVRDANTYTVTFDPNGGSTPVPATKSVTYGLEYGTLATTSRTGYTFAGWFTSASGGTQVTTSTIVNTAADHTLYAQWSTLPTHTVTFNANGGTGTMSPQTTNIPTALTLNTFTRTGYTFSGWNTATDGRGTAYTDGQVYSFAADLTLYAQWTANSYTVTFDANGGSTPVPATKSVTYGLAYGTLATNRRARPADWNSTAALRASATDLVGERSVRATTCAGRKRHGQPGQSAAAGSLRRFYAVRTARQHGGDSL